MSKPPPQPPDPDYGADADEHYAEAAAHAQRVRMSGQAKLAICHALLSVRCQIAELCDRLDELLAGQRQEGPSSR